MGTTDSVLIEKLEGEHGDIGVLTLNSPKTLNSLTLEMATTLLEHLSSWQNDDSIVAVILKGSGEKAFCAGGDIQALYRSATEQAGGPCEYGEAFFLNEYRVDYLIHRYPKPVLCFGGGIVMGGGLGLMAGADVRITNEATRIAMPEITIGLYPDVGGTYFLNKMPHNLGYFFGLTGAQINARDAIVCNLADACLPSAKFDELLDLLLALPWQKDKSEDSQLVKELVQVHALTESELASTLPSHIQSQLATLEHICEQTSLSEIVNAIYSAPNEDPWFLKAIASLKAGSPLSTILIYEQLKRHRHSSLREVFLSEYQLSTNIIRYPEFAEGVRALLIDKDHSPKWQFPQFGAVPSNLVESMFSPPWPENPLAKHI